MGQNAKPLIGLIGHGLVHQHMEQHLKSQYQTIQVSMDSPKKHVAACTFIVYCSDSWSPKILQEINRRCRQSGVALLPVYTELDEGIIGPCAVPQETGCTSCAELRKLAATPKPEERHLLRQYLFGERELAVPQPWLTSFSLHTLVQLTLEEIATYFQRPSQLRTRHGLLCVALDTLDCSSHHFLPLSACPDCGVQAGTVGGPQGIAPAPMRILLKWQ